MTEERESIEAFLRTSGELYTKLSEERGQGLLLYNDDADGICSGAITSQLLEELKADYHMVCLGKVFPQVIEMIDRLGSDYVIFVDLGSGSIREISEHITGDKRIYIFDHHDTRRVDDERILHLNPELFGLTGEKMASASTVCYLVARNMGEAAKKLAWMAVVGSAEIPGSVGWLNWMALQDAIEAGDVSRKIKGEKEKITVNVFEKPREYRSLSSRLTILGSVGYYDDGPQEAVSSCIFRRMEDVWERIKELEAKRRSVYGRLRSSLFRDGLYAIDNVQWFDADGLFRGMGTKVIGNFTSHLRFQTRVIHREKYILGFMDMQNMVPGLGSIEGDWRKVSSRVPLRVEGQIKIGRKQPVSAVIEAAAYHCGGYGDGHEVAGSAVIPRDNIEEFLKTFDRLAGAEGGRPSFK